MRTTRSLAIALATVAVLSLVAVSPAWAGFAIDLRSDIDCDAATGEWVVNFTLSTDNLGEAIPVISAGYALTGPSSSEGGLTFSPDFIANDAPASATLRLPGSSTGTLVTAVELAFGPAADATDTLDGSCKVPPTTTTTSTTAPAAVEAATPAFTG